MAGQIIPREAWLEWFQAFTQQHHGWLISVELAGPAGFDNRIADERPLESISVLANGSIEVRVGGEAPLIHRIAEPFGVRVTESSPGAIAIVTIDSQTEQTRIRFRMPIAPELVDGVIPG